MSDFEDDFGVDFDDLDFDPSEFENADFSDLQNSDLQNSVHDTTDNHLQQDDDFFDLDTFSPTKTTGLGDKSTTGHVQSPSGAARKITKKRAYTEEELEDLKYRKQKFQNGKQLLEIIKLEGVSFDIFNLPPRSEFELYVTSMGGKFRQTSVQAPIPEERKMQGMNTMRSSLKPTPFQAKERKNCTIPIQVPDDIGLFSEATRHLHTINRFKDENEEKVRASNGDITHQIDSLSLSHFLERILPVVEEFLEENHTLKLKKAPELYKSGRETTGTTKQKSSWSFSSGYKTLFDSVITSDRRIVDIKFNPTNINEIYVCYSALETENSGSLIKEAGLICIWNLNQPGSPSKVLISESENICFVIVPDKPYYVVAAAQDGSVQLWNLKESESLHSSIHIQGVGEARRICTRTPTYSTDWLIEENHSFPITDIKVIGYNIPQNSQHTSVTSNQVATLDSKGNMIFWIIVELQDNSISETDFGLGIGSSVKLVRGGEFNIFTGKSAKDTGSGMKIQDNRSFNLDEDDELLNATFTHSYNSEDGTTDNPSSQDYTSGSSVYAFDSEPHNPTQFIIASDKGSIRRRGRFVNVLTPQSYFCEGDDSISFTSAIAYSTLHPNCFLAGLSSGSLHIFNNTLNTPILTITSLSEYEIIQLRWHPVYPSIFFILDKKSNLFIIDANGEKVLFRSDISRSHQTSGSKPSSAHTFEVSQTDLRGVSYLSIGYGNGYVDVHEFSSEFSSQPIKGLELDLMRLTI